ncbi:hypothetical protein ACTMTJ_44675 [Phytohabitans sp. LJ34]|uniref:hypothetical protein n=1 Tax=Phytohabitans sp. LJ34 TaxID=3452217 RepID=UPI003F8AB780
MERNVAAGLRAWMTGARVRGGFLLILGDSSVGKTRLAYELAREVIPDFTVLHPDTAQTLMDMAAAGSTPPRLLVWLDEFQRYLQGPFLRGPTALTQADVQRLLDASTPVVIVGTAWPDVVLPLAAATQLTTDGVPVPRYPEAKALLTFTAIHRVTLSTMDNQERRRAAELAARDPRLAAAPVRALINAAVDASRLGVTHR